MFFCLSSVSGRTPLRESLESFIGIVDEHPITIVGLGPLHMGEIVLDWWGLEVWRVCQTTHVDTNRRRAITENMTLLERIFYQSLK